MASIFRTVPWQVSQLVDGVESGLIQLPDLQRPFVWSTTKVRDLFDSMYRGYPVGELMFWDAVTSGDVRPIAGEAKQSMSHQIVDGQQRLTSLYAAMRGHVVRDVNYRNKRITISFNPFTERFEVRTPALEKSSAWIADISTVFASPYRARRDFLKRYESAGTELTDEQHEKIETVFTKLQELQNYQFNVVQITTGAPKGQVADIFVRINSEGARLASSDYILTWLSVFWPEGREQIERFAERSRMTPERASEVAGERITWTPLNPFIELETGQIVRALIAVGQNRARLQDAYTALQAKDPSTGQVDEDLFHERLESLKQALPVVTNSVNWTEFIRSLQMAGFRSRRNVTSSMNIIYTYVLFLLGRTRYKVDLTLLRQAIARWAFMSQLTSRYTGSSESQLMKDLNALSEVRDGDAEGFVRYLDDTIRTLLTPDYWAHTVPEQFKGSNASLSPTYQCYLAALNVLDAKMFMLDMPVAQWMDPTIPKEKGLEGHHLFPRAYLSRELGITDIKRINQAANYAPTDWHTNIQISDDAPHEYWPRLVQSSGLTPDQLEQQRYWHALPDEWHTMEYESFLDERRRRMAQVTRDGFNKLMAGAAGGSTSQISGMPTMQEATLAELVQAELLKPGHLLDPVDPDWVVDAVITDDGTVMIDGEHEFDSLDGAARYLEVDNMSGLEFWALEVGQDVLPLTELAEQLV